MSDITRDQVVEYLSNLAVMDLVNLTRALEATWGVQAARAIAGVGAPSRAGAWFQSPETYVLRTSAADMEDLRARLRATLEAPLPKDPHWEGWCSWVIDADAVLAHTPGIRLRPGYRLQALVQRESSGGYGVVWAWPPGTTPVESRSLTRPPPGALPCAAAFATDGSARALLDGAILRRELEELGAYWHDASWAKHVIVDRVPAQPWVTGETARLMPPDLHPRVLRSPSGEDHVVFFTFTSLIEIRIVGHLDSRTRSDGLPCATDPVTFATAGPGGIP